jgi:hypothetical protein
MHEKGLALPLGIAASDAWRLHRNIDVVIESQFTRGTVDPRLADLSASVWTLMGGARVWGASRGAQGAGFFGQVVTGVLRASSPQNTRAGAAGTGLGLQPGFGIEIPVARAMAIRPQVDVLIGRIDGTTTRNTRFNSNLVFRFLR